MPRIVEFRVRLLSAIRRAQRHCGGAQDQEGGDRRRPDQDTLVKALDRPGLGADRQAVVLFNRAHRPAIQFLGAAVRSIRTTS